MGAALCREWSGCAGRPEQCVVEASFVDLALGEALDRGAKRPPGVGILEGAAHFGLAVGDVIGKDGVDQVGAAREMPVDRRRRDVCASSDVADGYGDAVLGERGAGDSQDAQPVDLAVGANCPGHSAAPLSHLARFRTGCSVSVDTLPAGDPR